MSDINSFMRLHHVEVPGTPGIKLVPFAILDRPMRRLVLGLRVATRPFSCAPGNHVREPLRLAGVSGAISLTWASLMSLVFIRYRSTRRAIMGEI
jgi:hypothetical protein